MINIKFITNNIEFVQWKNIQLFKSMNTISGGLTLQTPDFYKGKPTSWNIFVGDEYELKVDDVTISKGHIFDVQTSYGFGGGNVPYYRFIIVCRDKTAALVDTTYDKEENEWKNETILNIIRRLCAAYSIEVAYDKSISALISKRIDSFKHNEGDLTITSIIRLTNEIGVLPISYGDGRLTVIKGTTDSLTTDAIDVGANVKGAGSRHSNSDRFSNYTVKGLGIGNDNKQLTDFIQPFGLATDSVINTYRPMVIFSDVATDSGKCQDKAKWERNIRAGNSRKRTYQMNSWTQSDGKLWSIYTLARIKDWCADIDTPMLISDAVYVYDADDGSTCILKCVHKDTYSTSDSPIKAEFDR